MTLMTAMTMNCRGSLNGVGHSTVESRDRAMGREQRERKAVKARRCSRPTRPLGDRRRDMLRLHPAAAFLSPRVPGPRPACAGLPPRAALTENVAPGTLLRQHFPHYFSEEIPRGERGIRLRRTPLPCTRVNKGAKRRQQDQSANVDAYRTGGYGPPWLSPSRGPRSRNARPVAAKAKS